MRVGEGPVKPGEYSGNSPAMSWSESRFEHDSVVAVAIDEIGSSDSPRRGGENLAHVRALAEAVTPLPPIVVHRPTMRVVDGMHRLLAARARGDETIDVRFFDGSTEEAFVLAVRLNARHGLPLSRTDRVAAVIRIASTHPQWSDRAVAAVTGLSDKTVASIRRSSAEVPPLNTRIGRDGRVRPRNSAEGRLRASSLLAAKPGASLREIAEEAGIAAATVRDVRERIERGQDPVPPRQRAAEQRVTAVPSVVPPVTVERNLTLIVQGLRNDPALRFTEAGRVVLRLLDAHSIAMDDWNRFVEMIPVHCTANVMHAAQECAEAWRRFAAQLEQRSHPR